MSVNNILISVDVEEFDIPEEFGGMVPLEEKLSVSREGLEKTLQLFDKYNVTATFFVTAFWASHHPELIQQMAQKHEIASHAYYHSAFEPGHLEKSRTILEQLTGKRILGFRMPRLQPVEHNLLKAAGYAYDASMNPTWLPGRYNNLLKPRLPYKSGGLWIVPSSVSPVIRYPVFWLSMKNAPAMVTRHFTNRILQHDQLFTFYFHPWELSDLSAYKLPGYIRRVSGSAMEARLEAFLQHLQQRGRFCTYREYLGVH